MPDLGGVGGWFVGVGGGGFGGGWCGVWGFGLGNLETSGRTQVTLRRYGEGIERLKTIKKSVTNSKANRKCQIHEGMGEDEEPVEKEKSSTRGGGRQLAVSIRKKEMYNGGKEKDDPQPRRLYVHLERRTWASKTETKNQIGKSATQIPA